MAEKQKTPIQVLRERHGGMSEELKEYFKEQNRVRKLIAGALKDGPKTVPEIARRTGLRSEITMWHVIAMKRYGELSDAGRSGDYFKYALKERSQ
jgi:predicted transcriptional regulator